MEKNLTYERWVVEGSNGQILMSPNTILAALTFVAQHYDKIHQPYSAEGPMPEWMAEGYNNTKLGYLLRKVNVKVVETYE